jgi:adenylylsulfate kinase
VVWIDGLPSSGKSTLARHLARRLGRAGRPSLLLDGDDVRAALVPPPGYDPPARDAFYETLAGLAALAASQGLVAVVAATSSRRAHREAARRHWPALLEVFVDVPLEVCAGRDAKGLFALASRGEIAALPGAGEPFEPPDAPDVRARGGEDAEAVEEVARRLGA